MEPAMEEVYIKTEHIKVEVKEEPCDYETHTSEQFPPPHPLMLCTVKIEPHIEDTKVYDSKQDNTNIFVNPKVEPKQNNDIPSPEESTAEVPVTSDAGPAERVYQNGKINRLSCVECNKTYKNRSTLKNHMKFVHSGDQAVACQQCPRTFKSAQHLRSHADSVHAPPDERRCPTCGKVFHTRKKLNNHTYFAHPQPEERVACPLCAKTYKSRYYLRIHTRQVHPGGAPLPCPHCAKTFKTETLLQRHAAWAHPPEGARRCEHCNKLLPSDKGYRLHLRNVHCVEERATCEECRRVFKTKRSLDRHVRNIHRGGKRPRPVTAEFECKFCERRFNTNTALFWHHERYHAQSVPAAACVLCDKRYGDRAALQRHLTAAHSLELAPCGVCGKRFKSSINLQNHMRITHAPPEASRRCEPCGKTFKCLFHLRMHELAVHGDGHFECDVCGKSFGSKKYRDKHLKTHAAGRALPCGVCHNSYKNLTALNKHKRQVHGAVRCRLCSVKQPDIEAHMAECHPGVSPIEPKALPAADDPSSMTENKSECVKPETKNLKLENIGSKNLNPHHLKIENVKLESTSTESEWKCDTIECAKCGIRVFRSMYAKHGECCEGESGSSIVKVKKEVEDC